MKNNKPTLENKYILFVVTISLAVALLIHFPEMISLFDRWEANQLFPGITQMQVFSEVFFTLVSLLILFGINTILFRFNKTSKHLSRKKMFVSVLLTWVLSNLLGKCFVFLHNYFDVPAIDAMVHHYLHPLRDSIITLIVSGSCYIFYLIRQKQQMLIENEQLHAESLRNQYEALKNQLNPHMLFNSLNTLQSLIRETPDRAQDYLQQLSKVLRYTLQVNESSTVTLKDEMTFVHAYLFLLKMRYEDNLLFDIQINESLTNRCLPPMSMQVLMENAVKHNEISNRKPLCISISTDQSGWLEVSNKLQPKLTKSATTGIGLANLSKRYQLLFQKEIQIVEEKELFRVRIPLIHQQHESCNY